MKVYIVSLDLVLYTNCLGLWLSLSYIRYLQPRFYLLTSFSIDNIYIELFSVMTYPIEQVVSISLDLTLIKMILIRYVYIGNIFSKPKGCWFRHGLVGDMLGSFFFSLHKFVSDFVQFEPSIFCILKDLKDYMRQAGEVTYADAHKEHKNEGWGYILLFNEVFS